MKAPNFKLPDQNGKNHELSNYAGKWLIVYFYPKDDTPGCTKEACNFRDASKEYLKLGINIVGISKDGVKSHDKFANKFSLNFPILSDESLDVIKAYGAWGKKKLYGREYDGILRNTYLINPSGEIVKTYIAVKPETHSGQILKDLKFLV
jgi:thioredoxin-dependent peroxiredoxin